jgi:LuxR family maltose regulon positive regulatory protein
MITPLLTTKLYIPPVRPDLVSRPHLIQRLNEGLDRKLTLISASAGFGKTTLLSEWAAGTDRPVAWVSLDEGDDELTRFWAYLITALQSVQPDVGATALAALRSRQPPRTEPLLTGWINEIATMSQSLVLVLDDVHVIANQQIHDGLTFLLDNLPPQMHLVLSGRSDPPRPLARLRARGEMTELRASDLRFSEQEAAAFLNEVMKLDLSADDVAKLEDRTEGWIVGLQMAALSMRGRKDGSAFIAALTGTHRFILDYLVEEVLDQQSPAVQEFLLHTSTLERLTAPLCDAVTDGQDSQAILTQLEQANLFLVPLDDERRWYRYHRLFADLLRSRLEQTHPDQMPVLHRRASEWCEQNGLIAEAVSYALAAGDVERLARLVAGNALAMMDHGEMTTLVAWLDALPSQVVRRRPWLAVARAWALTYAGQFDAVEPILQDAENELAGLDGPAQTGIAGPRFVPSTAQARHVAGHIAAIRAYGAWIRGEGAYAVERAREAKEHLPEDDRMARSLAATTLGSALILVGDLAAAARALSEAIAISQAADDTHVALLVTADLAYLRLLQGRLGEAAAICEGGLQLADEALQRRGRRFPATASAHALLSAVLCEWNNLDGATYHARAGLELGEQWRQIDALTVGHVYLADVLRASGDIDAALEAVHKARQVAGGVSAWFDAIMATTEARLRFAQGDVEATSRWAQHLGLRPDGEISFRRYREYHILARVLVAQGRLGQALDLSERLLKMAQSARAMSYVIEILVLQAMALQAKGDVVQALAALERALALAEPEGYVRTFIDEGAPMGTLLRQAEARAIQLKYVRKLLAALEAETQDQRPLRVTKAAPPSLAHRPSSRLVEPLSERELQVLRLLATQLSSPEIAEELFISTNTVRSHIKSIYGKLNVHQRMDAVQRAKELGLL